MKSLSSLIEFNFKKVDQLTMNKLVDFVRNDAPTLVDIRRIRGRKCRRSLFIHAESTRKAGRGVGTRWKWSIRRTGSSTKPVCRLVTRRLFLYFVFARLNGFLISVSKSCVTQSSVLPGLFTPHLLGFLFFFFFMRLLSRVTTFPTVW